MTSSILRRVNLIGFSGIFALVELPIFWAAFPGTAKAQLSYAAISGTINDTTGAVVPGATVVLEATHALTFLVTYTWSKSIDVLMSGYFYEGSTIQDPNNINADKAVSGYDVTHMLNFSCVYALLLGKGQRWRTGSRALKYLVGNWQVNGILTFDSGVPYCIYMQGDTANTGNAPSYERLNLVGNPDLTTPTLGEWFNTAALVLPPEYTFGNEGRNILPGTWTKNLDAWIFREFPITETKRLEFTAEAFNAPNYMQYGTPGNIYNPPNYGIVNNTANGAR